jgi:hypothetical protein
MASISIDTQPPLPDNRPDVFFSRSTNNGASFRQGKNLSSTPGVSSDNERIAASGSNVYVVWSENAQEIVFRKSTDNGASFGSAQKASTTLNAILPQVVILGNIIFVAWQAAVQMDDPPDIFYTYSSNGGGTFVSEKNLSNNAGESEFRDHGLRQVIVSGTNIVVTWRDNTPGDFEIFFAQGN